MNAKWIQGQTSDVIFMSMNSKLKSCWPKRFSEWYHFVRVFTFYPELGLRAINSKDKKFFIQKLVDKNICCWKSDFYFSSSFSRSYDFSLFSLASHQRVLVNDFQLCFAVYKGLKFSNAMPTTAENIMSEKRKYWTSSNTKQIIRQQMLLKGKVQRKHRVSLLHTLRREMKGN